jgi:hypothetical protein
MTNNTEKYKITSLLGTYSLDYIVHFPTRKTPTQHHQEIVFFSTEIEMKIISNNTILVYLTMTLMLTLCNPAYKFLKSGLVRIGRYYGNPYIKEFKRKLSYENWENVLDSECDNDINV